MGGRGRQISEFEASLVYRVSSRTARATQRNPVSKPKKKKKMKSREHREQDVYVISDILGKHSIRAQYRRLANSHPYKSGYRG